MDINTPVSGAVTGASLFLLMMSHGWMLAIFVIACVAALLMFPQKPNNDQ